MNRDRAEVPPAGRAVARVVANGFGGTPSVRRYFDADESHEVSILTAPDRPVDGFTSLSTLGLYVADNRLDDRIIRVELSAIGESSEPRWANLLATAAFYVSKNGWLAAPGVVFPNVVSEVDLSQDLPHLFLAPPIPWTELNRVQVEADLDVHWLLAIPVSETERLFLNSRGYDEFERLME